MADILVGSQLALITGPNTLTISSLECHSRTQAPSSLAATCNSLVLCFLEEIYTQYLMEVAVEY